MNYFKNCTDKLLISIHGYKTPKKVIESFSNNFNYLIINPKFKQKIS